MTLQQLEYIVAVDRFRHFAKAAAHCHVTQPTLSAMVQKLEEELEVRLFDRSRQPVCVTRAGAAVVAQARRVLEEAERVKGIVGEEKGSLAGPFRLGILPTIAPYLLPRFLPQTARRYPEMDVRVVEMKTEHVKRALLHGEIDAGIVAAVPGLADFREGTLFYEAFCVYVSEGSRLAGSEVVRTADLRGEQLWLLDEGHCFRDQLLRFCQLKSAQASQQAYRLGSMETFMRMVEGGRGVTFIPQLAVLQLADTQKRLVRPFAVPRPARKIELVTRPDYVRLTLLRTLVQEIRASVPKEMLALQPTQTLVT